MSPLLVVRQLNTHFGDKGNKPSSPARALSLCCRTSSAWTFSWCLIMFFTLANLFPHSRHWTPELPSAKTQHPNTQRTDRTATTRPNSQMFEYDWIQLIEVLTVSERTSPGWSRLMCFFSSEDVTNLAPHFVCGQTYGVSPETNKNKRHCVTVSSWGVFIL